MRFCKICTPILSTFLIVPTLKMVVTDFYSALYLWICERRTEYDRRISILWIVFYLISSSHRVCQHIKPVQPATLIITEAGRISRACRPFFVGLSGGAEANWDRRLCCSRAVAWRLMLPLAALLPGSGKGSALQSQCVNTSRPEAVLLRTFILRAALLLGRFRHSILIEAVPKNRG